MYMLKASIGEAGFLLVNLQVTWMLHQVMSDINRV